MSTENLAQQLKRFKLRLKDIYCRPLRTLREIPASDGKTSWKWDLTYCTHHDGAGLIACDFSNRIRIRAHALVKKTDVALVNPEEIDRRLNLADAARKYPVAWFIGKKIRLLGPEHYGHVVVVKEACGHGWHGAFREGLKEVYVEIGGEGQYVSIYKAELAELPAPEDPQ